MYIKENKGNFTNLLMTQKLKSQKGRTETRKQHTGLRARGQLLVVRTNATTGSLSVGRRSVWNKGTVPSKQSGKQRSKQGAPGKMQRKEHLRKPDSRHKG